MLVPQDVQDVFRSFTVAHLKQLDQHFARMESLLESVAWPSSAIQSRVSSRSGAGGRPSPRASLAVTARISRGIPSKERSVSAFTVEGRCSGATLRVAGQSRAASDEDAPPEEPGPEPLQDLPLEHSFREAKEHSKAEESLNGCTDPQKHALAESAPRKQGTFASKEKQTVEHLAGALGFLKHKRSAIKATDGKSTATRSLPFGFLRPVLESPHFSRLITTLIIMNAVFIFSRADSASKRAFDNFELRASHNPASQTVELDWYNHVDTGFNVAFAIELVLQIAFHEIDFFVGPDKAWNLFDLVLVSMAIVEKLVANYLPNMTALRTLRIFRIFRTFRALRVVRFFRQLRVMTAQVSQSIPPLLWTMVFLSGSTLFFVIVFMDGTATYMDNADSGQEPLDKIFGSLFGMFISLFASISGGDDWWNVGETLFDLHSAYGWLFLLYIVFMMYGVLNIVIGLFVQKAAEIAASDHELIIQDEIQKKESYTNEMVSLFTEIDEDGSGNVTLAELKGFTDDERVQAYFRAMELDVSEAVGIFHLLDTQGDGAVSIDEFVIRCMQVKGPAKSVDLASLLFENKKLIETLKAVEAKVMKRFDEVERRAGF